MASLNNLNMTDLNLAFAKLYLRHSRRQRHRLYRKLEGMINMNEPLPKALERLWLNASDAGKHPGKPMAILLKEWLNKYKAGTTLGEALADSLPERDIMLIRAGEESGALPNALGNIEIVDKAAEGMKSAIMRAVSYPVLLFTMLFGILWMFGVTLIDPLRETAPTAVLQQISGLAIVTDIIRSYGLIVVALIAGLIIFIVLALPHWLGNLRIKFDKVPPWSWYRVWQGASFLLGLSALLKAQVPLKKALETLESYGSPWLRERIGMTRIEVLTGKNLGEALRATGTNFPDPQIALDLEILAERGDVGQIIDMVTEDWLRDQTERLNAQAAVIRLIGMVLVGLTIAWTMLSIVGITQSVQTAV